MIIDLKRTGLILLLAVMVIAAGSIAAKSIGMKSESDEQPAAQVSQTVPVEQTVIGSTSAEDEFFAEYRMDRERMRGKQVEMLREILNQSTSDKEARQAASLRLVEITADMEREMKAENLIKSKGYQDCVVIIQPESTTVVVAADHLQLDQEQEITALVCKVTKSREDQIVIIAREAQKG